MCRLVYVSYPSPRLRVKTRSTKMAKDSKNTGRCDEQKSVDKYSRDAQRLSRDII